MCPDQLAALDISGDTWRNTWVGYLRTQVDMAILIIHPRSIGSYRLFFSQKMKTKQEPSHPGTSHWFAEEFLCDYVCSQGFFYHFRINRLDASSYSSYMGQPKTISPPVFSWSGWRLEEDMKTKSKPAVFANRCPGEVRVPPTQVRHRPSWLPSGKQPHSYWKWPLK